MNRKDLITFFHDRPAINKTAFAKEAGVSKRTLFHALDRGVRKGTYDKIEKACKKYGWEGIEK